MMGFAFAVPAARIAAAKIPWAFVFIGGIPAAYAPSGTGAYPNIIHEHLMVVKVDNKKTWCRRGESMVDGEA